MLTKILSQNVIDWGLFFDIAPLTINAHRLVVVQRLNPIGQEASDKV